MLRYANVLRTVYTLFEIFRLEKISYARSTLCRGAFNSCELKFLGGDPSAGSPTDTL